MCTSRVVPLDALCELIAACRAAATIADLGGLLPLHHLCGSSAPLQCETLDALLEASGAAALEPDAEGR